MRSKKRDKCDKIFVALLGWLLLGIILNAVGVRLLVVHGNSMQPTLDDRELVIALKVRDVSSLEHGDVITFRPTPGSQTAYVKRIVGLPGDTVQARGDLLFINGTSDGISCLGTGTWGPVTIPDDSVFVLGDNRSRSLDSRTIGPIPAERIVARVICDR